MELDLNKFRTLTPINHLFEDGLRYLAGQVKVTTLWHGESLYFPQSDQRHLHYLLQGTLSCKRLLCNKHILPGTEATQHPLLEQEVLKEGYRVSSIKAVVVSVPCNEFDKLATLKEDEVETSFYAHQPMPYANGPNASDSAWMMKMLRTNIFQKLPADSIHAVFDKMEKIRVKRGDIIVHQGEEGKYFYAIRRGNAGVYRRNVGSKTCLAKLRPCDCFGEEGILLDTPRTASIRMLTNGVIMRLSAKDFHQYISASLVKQVNLTEADSLIREGAARIDVRNEHEYDHSHLGSAVNIPLYLLRLKATSLRHDRKYVLYCDDGKRSQVASYILHQMGYQAHVLKGGLNDVLAKIGDADLSILSEPLEEISVADEIELNRLYQ